MIYVGIDIAKLNHFAPAISSDGVILMEPFKFTNDGDGFSLLESNLTSICDDKDNIIIGLESTVHCNALGHCAGKLVIAGLHIYLPFLSDAKHPITSFFFILLLYAYIIMSLLIVIH